MDVGIEDDEREVGKQRVVVVAEGEIRIAEGEEELGEDFLVLFRQRDAAEVFDGGMVFAALGVGDAGEHARVGGGGGAGGLEDDVFVEAGGLAPEALGVVEAALGDHGFVGGDAGQVAQRPQLEDHLVERGVGGGELRVRRGRGGADLVDGVEEGGAGHADLDDVGDGQADLRRAGAVGGLALDPEDVLVALDDRRLEGRLLRLDGPGAELRGGRERGEHGEPEGGPGRFT